MDLMEWLRKQLEEVDTDLLREMMRLTAGMLMDAEVAAICGAEYRERSEERVNPRNGHRQRPSRHAGGKHRSRHPQAERGQLLPQLAAGAPQACGPGPGARFWTWTGTSKPVLRGSW